MCVSAGWYVMNRTNPELKDPSAGSTRLEKIRSEQSVNSRRLAERNREGLRQMLEEIRANKDDTRYEAALRWASFTSHTRTLGIRGKVLNPGKE